MLSRALPVVCAAAALVVGAAACGEDREGSVEPSGDSTSTTGATGTTTTPAASGGAPVATVDVRETEYELDPKDPDVAKVGLVRFKVRNAGKITHSLEIEGPGGEVETEGIKPGKSATLEADLSKPGTYKWYCPIADHESRGMKGQITVAGGGPGAARDHKGGHDEDAGKGSGDSGKRSEHSGDRDDRSGPKREDSAEKRRGASRGGGVY